MPPKLVVIKLIILLEAPLHKTCGAIGLICGEGFTVIGKVVEALVQVTPAKVNVGVTVIVANSGSDPRLVAVNGGITPVEEAANPILGLELVQM